MGNQNIEPNTQDIRELPELSPDSEATDDVERGRAMAHSASRSTGRNDMTVDEVLKFFDIPSFSDRVFMSGPNGQVQLNVVDAREGIQNALDEIIEGVQL